MKPRNPRRALVALIVIVACGAAVLYLQGCAGTQVRGKISHLEHEKLHCAGFDHQPASVLMGGVPVQWTGAPWIAAQFYVWETRSDASVLCGQSPKENWSCAPARMTIGPVPADARRMSDDAPATAGANGTTCHIYSTVTWASAAWFQSGYTDDMGVK